MHEAAESGLVPIAEMLVWAGALIDPQDQLKVEPLHPRVLALEIRY